MTDISQPDKPCADCPPPQTQTPSRPLLVLRRGYTPTRPSCVACVEKHLGAAYILLTELNDLPDLLAPASAGTSSGDATQRDGAADDVVRIRPHFSRRLRAIGHLFEAEDESQEWPDLHDAIRNARRAYQASDTMPDWETLAHRAHHQRSSQPSNLRDGVS